MTRSQAGWLVMIAVALSMLLVSAQSESPTTIPSMGRPLALYRNSHATAAACWLECVGLRKDGESDRLLIGTAAIFLEFCECDKPGRPTTWRIREGLAEWLATRGYRVEATETVLHSDDAAERGTFDDCTRELQAGRPVILTYCYDAAAVRGLGEAARRAGSCASVVAIGFVEVEGMPFLICHDGLTDGQAAPIDVDSVLPADIGLAEQGAWSAPGTSIYRWGGNATNIVITCVARPAPIK